MNNRIEAADDSRNLIGSLPGEDEPATGADLFEALKADAAEAVRSEVAQTSEQAAKDFLQLLAPELVEPEPEPLPEVSAEDLAALLATMEPAARSMKRIRDDVSGRSARAMAIIGETRQGEIAQTRTMCRAAGLTNAETNALLKRTLGDTKRARSILADRLASEDNINTARKASPPSGQKGFLAARAKQVYGEKTDAK